MPDSSTKVYESGGFLPQHLGEVMGKVLKGRNQFEIAKHILIDLQKNPEGMVFYTWVVEKGVSVQTAYKVRNKLRSWGFIRVEMGRITTLDSEFSLKCIRYAKDWIDFANIRKSQPEQLKEIITNLVMGNGR